MVCNVYQLDSRAYVLPFLSKLLLKIIKGGRIVVLCTGDMMDSASDYLWQIGDYQKILPHGTSTEPYAALQLIYLTEQQENPNNATNLVILDVIDIDIDFLKSFCNVLVITMQYGCFSNDKRFSNFNYWKLSDNKWVNIL